MTSRRAAARYAEALFGLAQETGQTDAVRAELDGLARLVERTPALAELLTRPDLEPERKLAAVTAALRGQFSGPVIALLAALLRHGRGEEVAAVADAFAEMADEAAGVVRAEARTVVALSGEQRARLAAVLSRMTGRRVVLEERIDPGILAGVRVRVGDRLVDGSAAGRLQRMHEELMVVGGLER